MATQTGSLPISVDDSAPFSRHPPRIFVLSDIRLLREGVVLALSLQSSVQVVGSSDLSIAAEKIADFDPNVLILDIIVSKGLDCSGAIRTVMPDVKIVALGVAEVEDLVIACAEAGISGFVPPSGSASDVVTAVHSAMRGELVCSPRTAGMLLNHVAKPSSGPDNDVLTPREREIVSLMSEGLSNKHIARQLGIQNATVKSHVHNILSKMRVRRRGEAAAQLLHSGINGNDSFIQTDASLVLPPPFVASRPARN
jgi:DNA-binding NarL/FixJ family response regulator